MWAVLVAFLTLLLIWVFRRPFGRLATDLGITRLSFLGIDLEFLQEKAREAYLKQELDVPPTDELRRAVALAARLEPLVRKRRILWVDDVPSRNRPETAFFQTLGILVTAAASTEEAVEAARPDRFDLVISDWERGGGDEGPILLKRLRDKDVRTPVLFYVGLDLPERRVEAAELRAVGLDHIPGRPLQACPGRAGDRSIAAEAARRPERPARAGCETSPVPRAGTLAAALAVALALSAPAAAWAEAPGNESAHGQSTIVGPETPLPGSVPSPVIGGELPRKPDGYNLSAREAIRIADRDPKVAQTAAKYGRLKTYAEVKEPTTWQIGYYAGDKEVVQVLVDDPTATVRESWTGYQVAWQMARGYEGQFGHLLNSPWVWIPLAAVFFFGLFDFRRPLKMVHLDLLVLLSFGISEASSTPATSASRCRWPTRRSSTCCAGCCGSGSGGCATGCARRCRRWRWRS